MIIFIIAIIAIVVAVCVWSHHKRLKYGNLTLITGGVKTGKTQLAVALCFKQYARQLKKWRKACRKARARYEPLPEKPLLYSNMPIGKKGFKYAPLTLDLVMGLKRFRKGSVIYYNEASLIAGSKDIKDEELNDHLLKFFKLIAHITEGGYLILDTQSPQDVHYTVKRSLSTYYDIWSRITLPVVSLIWLRENKLVDGENTVAIDTQVDTQDSVLEGGKKKYFRLILNKWWKYYDQYAYSTLVDGVPCEDSITEIVDEKKMHNLIRCKDIKEALKGGKRHV